MPGNSFSFIPDLNDDERILLRNLVDKYERSQQIYKPMFSFFLDERKQMLAEKVMASVKAVNYLFYGGFDDAQRKIAVFYPEHHDTSELDMPIKGVTFKFRENDKLTHRDILGSLMSLDIKRECIGDILIANGKACAFVYDTVVNDVLLIKKIGRVGVKVTEGFDANIKPQTEFKIISTTVSSMRIDAVVSAAVGVSREKAAALIRSSLVVYDHRNVTSISDKTDVGGVFSVRGYGKFIIDEISQTKKGRIHIVVKKYL